MMVQAISVLSVGAVLGDSDAESMRWSRAIGDLSAEVQGLREGVSSPVLVSVAYHVDGRLSPNDFAGVRTGRYDKRAGRLVVQAAVPRMSVESRRVVLVGLLDEAVGAAEQYAHKKGLAAGLPQIRAIVARVSRA